MCWPPRFFLWYQKVAKTPVILSGIDKRLTADCLKYETIPSLYTVTIAAITISHTIYWPVEKHLFMTTTRLLAKRCLSACCFFLHAGSLRLNRTIKGTVTDDKSTLVRRFCYPTWHCRRYSNRCCRQLYLNQFPLQPPPSPYNLWGTNRNRYLWRCLSTVIVQLQLSKVASMPLW